MPVKINALVISKCQGKKILKILFLKSLKGHAPFFEASIKVI